MSVDAAKQEALQKAAVEALWRRGSLKFKLHSTQLKILSAVKASTQRKFMVVCSRRLGKTYMLMCLAVELCLQKPGARVLYLAPYAKDAAELSQDTLSKILEDCPPDIRPEWKAQTKELVFSNGSIVRVKGVNGEAAEFLRGGSADMAILDECATMDGLEQIISSVVTPMTMTTGGRILMATTPPASTGHDSLVLYEQLAGKNATAVFTLRDAPHVTDATKIEYLVEAGETPELAEACILANGWPKGTTARREYFCEFVSDADSAVVPEFTKDLEKEIIREYKLPEYYYSIVSMDPGFNDSTGILYASVDFASGLLYIQDESLLSRANTEEIASVIKARETALWRNPPMLRVSDVDLRLVADLRAQHGLTFVSTKKEDSVGAVNYMRLLVGSKRIIINPRCTHLVRQLRNATWNRKGTDFARGRKEDGHFDLLAALKYMTRNAPFHANPFPSWWTNVGMPGGPASGSWLSPKRKKKQSEGLFIDTPLTRRLRKAGK